MSKSKIYLLLLLIVFLVYGLSLRYGFSQDDWFHLSISKANGVREFLNFFNPYNISWIFFRPLSTQVPYWLSTTFFSLQNAPHFLHLTMLLIHATNAYLVVLIARKYIKPNNAILLGIFYAISNIHFLSLFYIGAIQQLISTLFSLVVIYLFLKRRRNQFVLAILTACALLSKELAIRLPLTLLVLSYIEDKNLFRAIKAVIGPVIVTFLYFLMRLFITTGGALEYSLVFSIPTTLATLMWYTLFLLGYPEEILRYGLSLGRIDFSKFIGVSPVARLPIIIASVIVLTYSIYQLVLTLKIKQDRHWLIFPGLALLNILPIIFLPTHRYPHYLDLSLMFVGIYLLRNITKINAKVIMIASIIGVGMIASIMVDLSTHWTIKRALISQNTENLLLNQDACGRITSVAFVGPSPLPLEVSYALSDMNGPRIICNKPSLQVYYLGVSKGDIPQDAFTINTVSITGL